MNKQLTTLIGVLLVMTVASIDLLDFDEPEDFNRELKIRGEIVKNYNPGVQVGMPSPPINGIDERLVNENSEMENFVEGFFGADTISDKAFRIRQMQNVEIDGARQNYNFTLNDQNYCEISTIKGTVTVKEKDPFTLKINKENRTTNKVPC